MNYTIGQEYEVTGIGFVKLEAIEGRYAVCRTRMESQCTVELSELQEKPKPAPKYGEYFDMPMAPTPTPKAKGDAINGSNNWGPGNPSPKVPRKRVPPAEAKRIAKLKCVVFITENPDVKRFFRIVPRHPGRKAR